MAAHRRLPAAAAIGYAVFMCRRLATILCLLVLGLAAGGCSKCGPLWGEGARACHADTPR
jgi:hypothetical protein